MKYLITGITGFCAPHLANLLRKEGHEIYGLTRRSNGMETDILDVVSQDCFDSIKFVYGDLNDYSAIEKIIKEGKFDGIFHLAAQSHIGVSFADVIGTMKTNVMGSVNLIEAVVKHSPECKVCTVSTSEVIGNAGQPGKITNENEFALPANPYGVSKLAMDVYMQERMINGFVKGFVVRPYSYTGARRGKTFSISSDAYQIARIMKWQQPPVIEVGNLKTVRTVIDVRDTVRAMYLLMINPKSNGNIYNICGDTPVQMEYFTDTLIRMSNCKIDKVVSERLWRPIDIFYQHGDSTKLRELTGWKPEIEIEQTLQDLLQYWLDKI